MKRVLSERTGRFLKSSAGMLLLILLSSSGCGRGAAEKPGVVYNLEQVVRIRTGETGKEAL